MEILFKALHPNATIPKKATPLSGGWDVTCTDIEMKEPDFVICKLGFALTLPTGYKLTLVPRSSITNSKWVLQNSPGLGDEDYRGEYQYRFRCIPNSVNDIIPSLLSYELFPYKVGDRIGQVYLEEVIPMEFIKVDELDNTERGEGGYGSTNKTAKIIKFNTDNKTIS